MSLSDLFLVASRYALARGDWFAARELARAADRIGE
jgi:hypothetical protein